MHIDHLLIYLEFACIFLHNHLFMHLLAIGHLRIKLYLVPAAILISLHIGVASAIGGW
jgi:hypothetical protein